MKYGNPQYLHFLWLVPVIFFFFIYTFKQKRKALETFADSSIIKKLIPNVSVKKQRVKIALILIGLVFLIFTIARPQFGKKGVILKREGLDIIIAIDTSNSMLAEDIKPNRLTRAKFEIVGLLDKLDGDRVGLLAFAGDSFVLCPLTLDYSAAKMFLDILDTDIIPEQGTNLSSTILKAIDSFIQKEQKYKVLIILTDGEDTLGDPIDAVKKANGAGIRIYPIGIGSFKGEPIPIKDQYGNVSGYKRDSKGEIVMTKLNEGVLENIARSTGGKYFRVTSGGIELEKIVDDIKKLEKKELQSKEFSQYVDRYQYFLFVVIALLIAESFVSDKTRRQKEWHGRFD